MQKIKPTVETIRHLDRDQKIDKLISHMDFMYKIPGTNTPKQLSDKELRNIFEKIESRINYITMSPAFQLMYIDGDVNDNPQMKTKSIIVSTYEATLEEINNLSILENKYIIFYYIKTHINQTYNVRLALTDDKDWIRDQRDKKIEQILDK